MFHKKLTDSAEFVAGDATRLREIMHPKQDNLAIGYSVAHASVAVGNASLPHTLSSSETYYILAGEGIMYVNEETITVGKDDIFLVPAQATQHIENTGSVDLVFICIVEPYWQEHEEAIL